ncbi:hypothetical protein SCHPADRAFT_819209 [Schizopora paradoxa]|uniref:DNA mismatch repair protein MSH3 n=1 Tax=Schizopora paradoxa TaxID=27342 RepID=A0A0H2SNW5_9AGAM|nr:hypothetical protein SCHPADRAFT_819209 [Schizopora paradoxa]
MDVDENHRSHQDRLDESEASASENEDETRLPSTITSKAFASLRNTVVSDKSKGKKKANEEIGPSSEPYTPLEKQVKELKERYPDVLLMIEVGYKYKFYGEDAKIAGKELNIVPFNDRNFVTAGIPVHRRDIHLKKLLSQGYKVGIVGQTETAALKKVSDNRNAPFTRQLTHLYTAATFIDSVDDSSASAPGMAPIILSVIETPLGGMGVDERVSIALVGVTPSTGDVIWDEFDDSYLRSELETRMAHIRPSEVLVPDAGISNTTQKILNHFMSENVDTKDKKKTRIERIKKSLGYTQAFQGLSEFYSQKEKARSTASSNYTSGKLLADVSGLPQKVVIALAHVHNYLATFGLSEVLSQTDFFSKFTERQHMLLNANTLANLEIYCNQTDFTPRGSLIWVLDKTKTKFGSRLLRNWIGRPLVDIRGLQARVDAVDEILSSDEPRVNERLMKLREMLKGLPDLAKGLCRIQYGKASSLLRLRFFFSVLNTLQCTPKELATLLKAFERVATSFETLKESKDVGFRSPMLNDIVFSFPSLAMPLKDILAALDLKKAADDVRDELWRDLEKYPGIMDAKSGLLSVESELKEELKKIRRLIQKPAAQWVAVGGDEYLIEIKRDEMREIPATWHLMTTTKAAKRYHTPEVKQMIQERARYQEMLVSESNKAFLSFLSEIVDKYYIPLRTAVNNIAIADCLLSLAQVASQDNYSKPQFVEEDVLDIEEGRHPMIEALRSDPFIPNSICLGGEETKTKIITGPNMGGKSSAVRMVALIALMAQIGSYVPAASVSMSMLDAILTRMGASDDLARGRSTFMTEMSETSDILHCATSKSLVILDELGRGTSTFDGMAIAGAVLEHLIQNKSCKTLFITHYPVLASGIRRSFPKEVTNLHMGFTEETGIVDRKRTITFLYRLTDGIASGSYGIECARLAGVPEPLLEAAATKAEEMKRIVENKKNQNW